jgi:hypothetical protein
MKIFSLGIFFILISQLALAQVDSLIVCNGDVLIGEIKSMERGVLVIGTVYSDSDFKIEWGKVVEIYSNRNFIVTLSGGKRFYGKLKSNPSNKTELIIQDTGTDNYAALNDVILIDAVKSDFLSRLSVSLGLGFTFTKANNLNQFTTRTNLGYLTEEWSAQVFFNALRNAQVDVAETKRTDARLRFQYFLPADWFLLASVGFLQNDVQKIKLRSTTTGGVGNYVIHSNSAYFAGAVGVAWTNESFNDFAQTNRNSAEGFAGIEFNFFNIGDLSLLTNLLVYPSFTVSGRVRADFKLDLKYDLPLDFHIRLGYTVNYDSKPIEGALKNDYVFQTTFGWEL